jgi:putative oxidoreductase
MILVFLAQVMGGVLLLSGRFVPLALTLLAPVLLNILNFPITMDPGGIEREPLQQTSGSSFFAISVRAFFGILQMTPAKDAGSVP